MKKADLVWLAEIARWHFDQALLRVMNNNGTASAEAWDRINADPAMKRLRANLARAERLHKEAADGR